MQNAGKEEAMKNGEWPKGDTMMKLAAFYDKLCITPTIGIARIVGGHWIVLQWIHWVIAVRLRR